MFRRGSKEPPNERIAGEVTIEIQLIFSEHLFSHLLCALGQALKRVDEFLVDVCDVFNLFKSNTARADVG